MLTVLVLWDRNPSAHKIVFLAIPPTIVKTMDRRMRVHQMKILIIMD